MEVPLNLVMVMLLFIKVTFASTSCTNYLLLFCGMILVKDSTMIKHVKKGAFKIYIFMTIIQSYYSSEAYLKNYMKGMGWQNKLMKHIQILHNIIVMLSQFQISCLIWIFIQLMPAEIV